MTVRAIRIDDAARAYLAVRKQKVAANTYNHSRHLLARFQSHLAGSVGTNVWMSQVSEETVEAFFYGAHGVAGTVSASTFNVYRTSLRSFFTYCQRRRWVVENPLDVVDFQRVTVRERMRLSAAELYRLLDVSTYPRDRVALAIGMNTGMRAREVMSLTVGDVDLGQGQLTAAITKSRLVSIMPITADLDAELRRWLVVYATECGVTVEGLPNDWLLVPAAKIVGFPSPGVSPRRILRPFLPVSNPQKIVQNALRAIGLPTEQEGFHTLRRSVALLLFEQLEKAGGRDSALLIVGAWLHHRDIATTQRYLGLNASKQKVDTVLRGQQFLGLSVPVANVLQLGVASG